MHGSLYACIRTYARQCTPASLYVHPYAPSSSLLITMRAGGVVALGVSSSLVMISVRLRVHAYTYHAHARVHAYTHAHTKHIRLHTTVHAACRYTHLYTHLYTRVRMHMCTPPALGGVFACTSSCMRMPMRPMHMHAFTAKYMHAPVCVCVHLYAYLYAVHNKS
jgi:hypothetical protein